MSYDISFKQQRNAKRVEELWYRLPVPVVPSIASTKGWLIDFDFGGRHNDVCYPEGYKPLLFDGYLLHDLQTLEEEEKELILPLLTRVTSIFFMIYKR